MTSGAEKSRRDQLRREAGLKRNSDIFREQNERLKQNGALLRKPSDFLVAHACFECRKSFKRKPVDEGDLKCPQCGGAALEMGRGFKAPKRTEIDQWRKVKRLWDAGYRFHTNTRGKDIVPFPDKLKDVDAFIRENPDHPFRLK